MKRYHLTLSTYSGIVFNASHWWCRITWYDGKGVRQEEDAERGPEDERTRKFNSKPAARRAGLALAKVIAGDEPYVVTEGSITTIDPQEVLAGPAELKYQLNILWWKFEKLKGWDAPRSDWPKVQSLCDQWSELLK